MHRQLVIRVDGTRAGEHVSAAKKNPANFYNEIRSKHITRRPGGALPPCPMKCFPSELNFRSPYLITFIPPDAKTGSIPPEDAVIWGLPKGADYRAWPRLSWITNAPVAVGAESYSFNRKWADDGSLVSQDTVHGPEYVAQRHAVEDDNPQSAMLYTDGLFVAGTQVMREFWDHGRMTGLLGLNDLVRPHGEFKMQIKYVEFDPKTGHRARDWAWGDFDGREEWECTHYGPQGEIVRVEKCNGDTRYFEGPPHQEALRRIVLYNAEQDDSAHVAEWYEGPHGNARLVRAMCRNGDIVFYTGDSPDNMRKDRRWTLYGFIDYYTGEKGREHLTGELGLQPRFSPDKDGLSMHIDWLKGIRLALEHKCLRTCPFDIGTRVTLQGLPREDLNGRLGVIDGWKEQEQRCLVRLVPLEDDLVLSVKVERLLLSKEHCVAAWRRANELAVTESAFNNGDVVYIYSAYKYSFLIKGLLKEWNPNQGRWEVNTVDSEGRTRTLLVDPASLIGSDAVQKANEIAALYKSATASVREAQEAVSEWEKSKAAEKKRARKEKKIAGKELKAIEREKDAERIRQTREVEKQRRAQQLEVHEAMMAAKRAEEKAQEELRKHQAAEERARRAEAAEKPLTPRGEPRLSERGSKVAYRKDNRAKHKNAKAAELEHAVHVLPEQRKQRSDAAELRKQAAHTWKVAREAKEKAERLRELAKQASAAFEAATHAVPGPPTLNSALTAALDALELV